MTFKETLFDALKIIAIYVISIVGFFSALFAILYISYLFCQATSGWCICSM